MFKNAYQVIGIFVLIKEVLKIFYYYLKKLSNLKHHQT